MAITIQRAMTASDEVRELLRELDAALAGPYAADQQHGLSLEALFQPEVRFFVAHLESVAAGCGGLALLEGYGEVKRMFVRERARGRGAAQALLARIEAEARDAGLPCLRLETGIHQEAALRFYEREGFRRCDPFGPYAAMPAQAIAASLFYEKAL